MRKIFHHLFVRQHLESAKKQLRFLESKLESPQTRLAIPFLFQGKGFFKKMSCKQNSFEISELYRFVCQLQPRNVLEIGTAQGGSLYLWLQAAHSNATVISVDLPKGPFGGGYSSQRIPFYQAFAKEHQQLHLIRADSHSAHCEKKVQEILQIKLLDFLVIDGDHTYNGVKQDFELYSNLVKPGGYIAIHDILPRQEHKDIEVHKYWNEIKSNYQSQVFVDECGFERKVGWGLIKKPMQ